MTQAEAAKLQPGFNLSGRRAVVFAGTGQLGRAVTEALAEAGAAITVSGDGSGATVRGPWNFEAADVGKAAEVDRVFEVAGRARGGTDVAVFVADAYQAGPIGESKAAAVVTANLLGAYHVFRAAANATAGVRDARLIAVIPGAALRGLPNLSALSASVAGIVGLVRSLSQELGPRGTTVNAIATGWMSDTPGHGPDDAQANMLLRYIPMRRFGQPAEIGPLAVYLASPEAGFVNGSVFAVDGGVFKHL